MNTKEDLTRLLQKYCVVGHIEAFWRRPSAAPHDRARFYARVLFNNGQVFSCSEARISDEASVEALVWDRLFHHVREYLHEPWSP